MKLACIVLAHRDPWQLAALLTELRNEHVRVYLHLDKKATATPFVDALRRGNVGEVTWLPRRRSIWGGIEIVDAALDGLRMGLVDSCDYFLLLSGQDLPLWHARDIVSFFEAAADRSFIEYAALPLQDWRLGGRDRTDYYTLTVMGRRLTCVPRGHDALMSWKGKLLNSVLRAATAFRSERCFPAYAKPFGGSQWWNLSAVAARYILRFLQENPTYRQYHEHTLLPDELFFQSLLLGTSFCDSHEVINDSLRFMIWPSGGSHPRTLGPKDIDAMVESGRPFARKFDSATTTPVLAALHSRASENLAATASARKPWRD